MYEFCLLGPLEVRSDGRTLDLGGGQKQRVLLATLLLEANRVVSSDRLIEAIWEEQPTPTAQKGLQVLVSQARKLLGKERIESRPPGYLLNVGPGELDLDRFHSLRADGRLEEALALWRGAPLADLAYHRFAQTEIARLEELRLAALEDRLEQDLAAGRHREVVGELEALIRAQPARERLVGQLLLALYRSGRQADALDAYQEARRALVDGLGIEPGPGLRELQQQILRQDPALDLAAVEDSESPLFVGRRTELAELLAAYEDVVRGRGRLVLLEGEPGIGKSYLADEFARRARSRGALVLAGRAWEAGGAPAYWPWVQLLRAYGRVDARPVDPPDLEQPSETASDASRFRLFDEVATFLRRAAGQRPLVLLLDDLQAADVSSLLLVQFVARELPSMCVLVIGAYRSVDPVPGEALRVALMELAREPVTRVLRLGGLSEEEVAEYVSLTASGPAAPELAVELQEETEGNPLFVAEMIRLLEEEGGGKLVVPAGVRSVITRRLAHLSEDCRRLLVVAAVLGREFTPGSLARAAGVSEEHALELLDEAMRSGVVADVADAPASLRFAHALIRDALYEGVTAARRIGLHRQVVSALEALYRNDSGRHATELAHHALAASDFDRALSYARRGGDRALALLAYEEAVRLYELALDALALGTADDETHSELLLALGDARARAGDTIAAKNAFLDAAAIGRRAGFPRVLARSAVGYGGRIVWGRAGGDGRLVPLLEEALRVVGDEDANLRARLLARLSGALRDEPSRERRDALSKEAVDLARRRGDAAALAYALGARAHAIAAPDTAVELLAIGSELCETAASIGDRERICAGHAARILGALMLGDLRSAEEDVTALARLADELRQPPQLWDAATSRALLALGRGRFAEAAELAERAFALGERAVPDAAIPIHVLHEFGVRDLGGELESMEPALRALADDYPARAVFRCVLVYLHARIGWDADAEHGLHELGEAGFAAVPFDQEWLFAVSLLAEAAAILGERACAATLYDLLHPWASLNAVDLAEGMRGSLERPLGLLAALAGRDEDAVVHFERALEANERMGLAPWTARTREALGRFLVERGAPGDAEQGRAQLEEALATYRELGIKPTAPSSA